MSTNLRRFLTVAIIIAIKVDKYSMKYKVCIGLPYSMPHYILRLKTDKVSLYVKLRFLKKNEYEQKPGNNNLSCKKRK